MSASEEDKFSDVDNKYTSPSEEEDEERHEVMNEQDIGDELKERVVSSRKSYRGNFSTIKEEAYGCPYGSCGRKFVSASQLKEHIERRHAPNRNVAKKAVAKPEPIPSEKKPEVSYRKPETRKPITSAKEDKVEMIDTSSKSYKQ